MFVTINKFIKISVIISFIGILFALLISILFIQSTNAEILIYDNITTSQYKILKIDDISNIKFFNDYTYEVYINNSYYGTFSISDKIFIKNNSDVHIVFIEPIKTKFESSYDIGKVYLQLGVMFFVGFGIVIILVIWFIRKVWSKK